MNRKQREKNRATAKWLRHQKVCPNCGMMGLHYVVMPQSLDMALMGLPRDGFWICDTMYDENGRRKEL
jgi:hypothetical protein